MKYFLLFICMICGMVDTKAGQRTESDEGKMVVAFWNLENLYDTENTGANSSDEEFSPDGLRHWTRSRMRLKCEAIGKTLLYLGDVCGGHLPDVVGFAEVENYGCLQRIITTDLLSRLGYGIVHFDSPDNRGIDVGLIFRKSQFIKETAYPITIEGLTTRDILRVDLRRIADDRTFTFFVNHFPSQASGPVESDAKRLKVAMRLFDECYSLPSGSTIIAMGDFNDSPDDKLFGVLSPILDNLALPLSREGEGSHKYRGEWNLLDMFFTSKNLRNHCKMDVLDAAFLLEKDREFGGDKPFRTYNGPAYNGGVSDHLPVYLIIED